MSHFDPSSSFAAPKTCVKFVHLPDNDESEAKILLPERASFSDVQNFLASYPSITFEYETLEPKDYYLVNLALDTFVAPGSPENLLFHHAKHQCRLRMGMPVDFDNPHFKSYELNIKSKLHDSDHYRQEYEFEGDSYQSAFIEMQNKMKKISGLNIESISPENLYFTTIPVSARIHGIFVHHIHNTPFSVAYLLSYDETVHIDCHASSYHGPRP